MFTSKSEFEKGAREEMAIKSYAAMLERAADNWIERRHPGHNCSPSVALEITRRFGREGGAVQCMEYLLQLVSESGTVGPHFAFLSAMHTAWREMEKALDVGTPFDFGGPNEEFRRSLRVVEGGR